MSDYRLNDLDGIIDAHRARKIRDATVKKKRETTAQGVSERWLEYLQEIVLPVLERFSARLNDKKHRTTVSHVGAVVTFSICPHSAQPNVTSTFTIRRGAADTIQLEGEISKVDGCAHHHRAFRPASQRIADLDQGWVEEHVLSFIKQVLDVN
jgi:hypothetical protein